MKFDKKFVHCVWDGSLVGKLCVFSDDVPDLKQRVERCDPHYIAVLQVGIHDMDMDTLAYPFYKDANAHTGYRFIYYDPNLECKFAHEQGKQIQYFDNEEWLDVVNPSWLPDTKYRVKPDKWYVHDMAGGKFYKDNSSDTYVEFEGTEKECDAWIAEHTPKTRRFTNRELAKWCADNKGQYTAYADKSYLCINYQYPLGEDDEPVHECIRIREWDSDEWHEPLVEVKE